MKISLKEWVLFLVIAILGLGLWYKLSYPEFSFIDLSVDRRAALEKAESYLALLKVNPAEYRKAVVFISDDWSDRYLQKTLGWKAEEEFIKRHGYEIFAWQVRFFKELKKEEYLVSISPSSGKVLGFKHIIEDIAPRALISQEKARREAEEFLQKFFNLDFKEYEFNEQGSKRYEQRIDYYFSWKKKGADIPWQRDQGAAKILIGATVSGNEVREFYSGILDIPENFRRYIDKQLTSGEYLSNFSFLAVFILLIWSIYLVFKRQHNLVIRSSKKWFIYLGAFLLFINLASVLNNIQAVIIGYNTSTSFVAYMGNYLVRIFINLVLFSFAFILPGLAGESLCREVFPGKKYVSFFHYLNSTWFSRSITRFIILGYLFFFVMLGMQSVIFFFGQRYLGVWKESISLRLLSSSYLPFLTAFIIGSIASLNEEITYRMFGLSWSKKYFKSSVSAVIFSALIWGVAHTRYAIFPTWFRAIEIGIIGIFLGAIFIKYGLVPLLVAHYLFDVFWNSAAYILGRSNHYLFMGSLAVWSWPLVFALVAYFLNREEKEKEIELMLSATQKYNLSILISFVAGKKSQGINRETLKEELIRHNWDTVLIDMALKRVFG